MEELTADVGEAKTRGCVWSGRVLMSIERDASIECVVAEEDKGISFIYARDTTNVFSCTTGIWPPLFQMDEQVPGSSPLIPLDQS